MSDWGRTYCPIRQEIYFYCGVCIFLLSTFNKIAGISAIYLCYVKASQAFIYIQCFFVQQYIYLNRKNQVKNIGDIISETTVEDRVK